MSRARGIRALSLLFCAAALAVASTAPAQSSDPTPLRVLFLGEPDTQRADDFAAFFGERFASVQVADRWDWDRAVLDDVDVVVLDWPQRDGISPWMVARDRTVPPRQPLGARADWSKPTVLLGSAGLNLAWAWDVKGAFG